MGKGFELSVSIEGNEPLENFVKNITASEEENLHAKLNDITESAIVFLMAQEGYLTLPQISNIKDLLIATKSPGLSFTRKNDPDRLAFTASVRELDLVPFPYFVTIYNPNGDDGVEFDFTCHIGKELTTFKLIVFEQKVDVIMVVEVTI